MEKTLRDEFAMAALQGLLSATDIHLEFIIEKGNGSFYLGCAKESYEFADAMVEARQPDVMKGVK